MSNADLIEEARRHAHDMASERDAAMLIDLADALERAEQDARRFYACTNRARLGQHGEWVIFPDDPHESSEHKEMFVKAIDAAIARESNGKA